MQSDSTPAIPFVYDDGGRTEANYKDDAGDCGVRAIAIASGLPYATVYDALKFAAQRERPKGGRKRSSVRDGLSVSTFRRFAEDQLGATWTPTMGIGTGCRVHLRSDELPSGQLVVRLSGHYATVVDGVLYDTFDCSRDGTRCVYGYWTFPERDQREWLERAEHA